MSEYSNKAKPLNVDNLLAAMETLREMMAQEGKPIVLSGNIEIDVEKSMENWRTVRGSK